MNSASYNAHYRDLDLINTTPEVEEECRRKRLESIKRALEQDGSK